jgi:hypothetical protein
MPPTWSIRITPDHGSCSISIQGEALVKRWRAPRDYRTYLFLLGAGALLFASLFGILRVRDMLEGTTADSVISLELFSLVFATLVAALATLFLAWRAFRFASLHYKLDRNAIYIRQRGSLYIIPLDQIQRAVPREQWETPGRVPRPHSFGRGRIQQQIIIETAQRRYRLAIAERDTFLHELAERRRLGVVRVLREGLTLTRPGLSAFWSATSIKWLIVLTCSLNIALWGLLAWRYGGLPETVPVRFDPIGGTAGTRPRTYTLLLPAGASSIALVNTILAVMIFRRTRLGSELLLLGAMLTQVLLLVAVWFIVSVAE